MLFGSDGRSWVAEAAPRSGASLLPPVGGWGRGEFVDMLDLPYTTIMITGAQYSILNGANGPTRDLVSNSVYVLTLRSCALNGTLMRGRVP